MKKIVLVFLTIIIVLFLDSLFIFNIISYDKVLNDTGYLINSRIEKIHSFLTKYNLPKSGIMEVDVNYRGAHGENYPSSYNYKYEFTDKLYLEDIDYTSINYDKKILNFFNKLTKLKSIDLTNCSVKKSNGVLDVSCDREYFNNMLGTNFKNVEAVIHTKGLVREIDYIEIYLDDIKLTLIDNDLTIEYKKNNIKISFNETSYYININDLLKANIIINDAYSCSVVISDKVYYFEIKDNELFIKFNSVAAMYNNITISAKSANVYLDKSMKLEDIKNNPIANYIANSDFNIWR